MEDIIEYFTHQIIPKIEVKPIRDQIKEVQEKIYENAASVPCELGGGMHGYLGVTMSGPEYLAATGEEFHPHTNPGTTSTFPENGTQYQIAAARESHKKQLYLFKEQRNVIAAHRNQITKVFEKPYLQALYRSHIGYSHCTIPDIFQYLYNNYGKITDNDILDNMESMKTQ